MNYGRAKLARFEFDVFLNYFYSSKSYSTKSPVNTTQGISRKEP